MAVLATRANTGHHAAHVVRRVDRGRGLRRQRRGKAALASPSSSTRAGFGVVLRANCIVGAFADDHVHVVHRRGRILRRAHAARRVNCGGTLIPHAVACGPLPSTPRPIVIAVVGATLRTAPVTRLGSSHLRVTRRHLVRGHAVDLAPVAGPADRKQAQALGAPLEEKADVVHVERGRRWKTCPQRPPRASCASRRPRRGFRLPPGPLLFFGVLGPRIYGEILAGSTFLPTDPTVRSRRLQAAVNIQRQDPPPHPRAELAGRLDAAQFREVAGLQREPREALRVLHPNA